MRILKTTQTYYPYLSQGGPPAKVRAIAKELARRGHKITVLTADRGESDGETMIADLGGWSRYVSEWGWETKDNGVETIYLPTVHNYRATTINSRMLRFYARRLRVYDLVHIYGLYDLIGATAPWFCRRYGVPYVLEPLGMFGPKVRSGKKKRLYRKVVGDALFEGAAAIVATSEIERDELVEGGIPSEKIVLRRNGIDLSEFENLPAPCGLRRRFSLSEETPLILFLGRISFIKGLEQLVKAFAGLDSQANLIIAGPDDRDGCAQTIRSLIEGLEIGERVRLIGPLYGKAKLEALVDASFLVLPSRYESFGNAAAEAIACGTPVLVTDKCGIAPLVENAGLSVSCDLPSLRDGMKTLLEDEHLSSRFRNGCVEAAKNLSWDEPVTQMEQLYSRLHSQGTRTLVSSQAPPISNDLPVSADVPTKS